MSTPSEPNLSLRGHLLSSLSSLPNAHRLSLTILISEPKRTSSLFPHTPHPPKCLQQEYLVVLSSDLACQSDSDSTRQSDDEANKSTLTEDMLVAVEAGSSKSTPKSAPRVLVSAISAYLYTFPNSTATATSTSQPTHNTPILYISKIDSSGYTPQPLPFTRHLIRSFLSYFVTSLPSVRVQLFARSQRQYLFANSADGPLKKVLGGAGLCKWWKGVYEDVCVEVTTRLTSKDKSTSTAIPNGDEGKVQTDSQTRDENIPLEVKYLLPGYDEVEAENMLGTGRPLPQGLEWRYEPPFGESSLSTTTASTSPSSLQSLPPSLATLIPSLPDDPKTRFLEELVMDASANAHPHTSVVEPDTSKRTDSSEDRAGAANADSIEQSTTLAMAKVKTRKTKEAAEDGSLRRAAHVTLSRVSSSEFWERMGFRQECASGDVTGFFTLERSKSGQVTQVEKEDDPALGTIRDPSLRSAAARTTKAPQIRQEITDRILTALTNIDFATLPLAKEGTEIWIRQVRSLVGGEIGPEGWEQCTASIDAKDEDVLKQMTGGGLRRKQREEVVTMLQPRKKKKAVVARAG
ncbi:hypothetical protein IAR55_002494 [Kwoniella newhampshirensis]|uniref:histone acetyltransferase n=1 Tax=Kwoniella newhampshirensis TaxID=1651941 RepID=A0AAW0Z1M6_9TREE